MDSANVFWNLNKPNCQESDRFSQDAALILSWMKRAMQVIVLKLNISCNKLHQTWLRKLPACFCSHRSSWAHRSHLQRQHCNTSQMKQFVDPIINLGWKTSCSERQLWTHLHRWSDFTKVGSTPVFNCYQLVPPFLLIPFTDEFILVCLQHHSVLSTQVHPKVCFCSNAGR